MTLVAGQLLVVVLAIAMLAGVTDRGWSTPPSNSVASCSRSASWFEVGADVRSSLGFALEAFNRTIRK